MIKKTLIIIILTYLGIFKINAQKYELGKVTIEELKEKQHPKDTSAVAVILFNKGEVRYDYSPDRRFDMITVVKTKIKIYKKEGYNFANYVKKYFIGTSGKESVSFSDAVTYNLVDGKIEKTKLKSNGEFDEKVNKYWNRKKITMPNVKEGSIIEFEYTLKSDGIGTIDQWEFQNEIPVNYSELKTYVPEYFIYNVRFKGVTSPVIQKDSSPKSYIGTYHQNVNQFGGARSESGNYKIDYQENTTTYIMKDLKALKDEKFVNNIKNYICSVYHELSQLRYPNQPYKSFSTNWESVVKTIYDYDDFGGELNKTGYFEDDVKVLLEGLNSREERISVIFNFVKSKVKWNTYYGYNCDDGVKKAYKDGVGNSAEINLMLTAMLRYAGIEANPVLISTRSNGIPLFPSRTAFNYVIAAVEIENGLILLDATDKNAMPNILPDRDLNWFGRLIRKNGSSTEVDLMPKMISRDNINLLATINDKGEIEGQIREQYFDYCGFVFRDKYGDLNTDSYLEILEKNIGNVEVSNYKIENIKEIDKQIIETYSYKDNNSVEIIGDKMFFSGLLFLTETENYFKPEKREYPIDFSFPKEVKIIVSINIPENYMIESLPKPVSIPMSENLMTFRYNTASTNKQIQLSATLNFNTSIIGSEYYDELKAFFAEVVKRETEKVVLKRI